MLRILLKFMISSDGESPGQLVQRLRKVGGIPLAGMYDIEVPLSDNDRLFPKLEEIHKRSGGAASITQSRPATMRRRPRTKPCP